MITLAPLERWERRAEWPLAAVALTFLAAYSIDVLVQPHGTAAHILDVLTKMTWLIFAIDYVVRFWLAPDRWYWFRHHLVDLAVVAVPLLRGLRVVRVVILITALQSAVGNAIRGRVAVYAFTAAFLLMYVASLAVLHAERTHPEASIRTFGQAVWWSIATITTVGYGDEYPITTTGKFVAALLMLGGVSLVGTITATIASWIVQRVAEGDAANQIVTAAHIEQLRDEIIALRQRLDREDGSSTAGPPTGT